MRGFTAVRALALAFALTLASPYNSAVAQTADFWVVGTSTQDERLEILSLIDLSRVTETPQRVSRAWVWRFVSPHSTRREIAGGYTIYLYDFDCTSQRFRILSGSAYEANGTAMGSPTPTNWDYVTPGSLVEAEMQFVCATPEQRPTAGVRMSGDAAEIAARLFARY